MTDVNAAFSDLPADLIRHLLFYFSDNSGRTVDYKSIRALRVASKSVNAISAEAKQMPIDLVHAYIKENPEITERQKQHLFSTETLACIHRGVDSVDNLCQQASTRRLHLAAMQRYFFTPKTVEDPKAFTRDYLATEIENVLQLLKALNRWRLARHGLTTAFNISSIQGGWSALTLRQCAVLMGVPLNQLGNNFSVYHLNAILKGKPIERIANLDQRQTLAFTLGATAVELNHHRLTAFGYTLYPLLLGAFGIPPRDWLALTDNILRVLLRVYACKARGLMKQGIDIKTYDWKHYHNRLRAKFAGIDNFEGLSDAHMFRFLTELPDEVSSDWHFGVYHAMMYLMGYPVAECRKYTKLEAKAICLGIPADKVMSLRCSSALLYALGGDWGDLAMLQLPHVFENLPTVPNILDSDKFKKLSKLTSNQIIMSRYYKGDDIAEYEVADDHIALVTGIIDGERTSDWYREALRRPGIDTMAAELDLGAVTPQTGYIHAQVLGMHEQLEQLDHKQFYARIKDLNRAQVLALVNVHLPESALRNAFVSSAYHEATISHAETLIRDCTITQLQGLNDFGLSLPQVQEPWYRDLHSIAIRDFSLLISFDDLNPNNIQELCAKYNLPKDFRNIANVSCAHVIAFVRGASLQDLSKCTEVQALGLALGLNFAQVDNSWLTSQHLWALTCDFEDDPVFGNFLSYETIKELNAQQIMGVYSGLSRADVLSSWYTKYHMLAAHLGYNHTFICQASTEQIKTAIASTYNCNVDFDAFIDKYVLDWAIDKPAPTVGLSASLKL